MMSKYSFPTCPDSTEYLDPGSYKSEFQLKGSADEFVKQLDPETNYKICKVSGEYDMRQALYKENDGKLEKLIDGDLFKGYKKCDTFKSSGGCEDPLYKNGLQYFIEKGTVIQRQRDEELRKRREKEYYEHWRYVI
jgi:hypothetical protein